MNRLPSSRRPARAPSRRGRAARAPLPVLVTALAVLGACAVSAQSGLTCTEDHDAVLKAAIIGSSSRCLMPAPPRKLTRSSTYGFGALSDLDTLLTTTDIDPETLTGLQEAGVSVEVHDV